MGLILNTQISTGMGSSNEAYLNIKKITFRKKDDVLIPMDSIDIEVNLYLNKETRDLTPSKVTNSYSIPRYFGAADIGSPGELSDLKGNNNLFEFAYSVIKNKLEDKGISSSED